MKIDGRVALVTGAASGLGLATTKQLLDSGASVVMVDLPTSNGDTVAKELGDAVLFQGADVTSEEEVRAAVDLAAKSSEASTSTSIARGSASLAGC